MTQSFRLAKASPDELARGKRSPDELARARLAAVTDAGLPKRGVSSRVQPLGPASRGLKERASEIGEQTGYGLAFGASSFGCGVVPAKPPKLDVGLFDGIVRNLSIVSCGKPPKCGTTSLD